MNLKQFKLLAPAIEEALEATSIEGIITGGAALAYAFNDESLLKDIDLVIVTPKHIKSSAETLDVLVTTLLDYLPCDVIPSLYPTTQDWEVCSTSKEIHPSLSAEPDSNSYDARIHCAVKLVLGSLEIDVMVWKANTVQEAVGKFDYNICQFVYEHGRPHFWGTNKGTLVRTTHNKNNFDFCESRWGRLESKAHSIGWIA